MTVRLSDVFLRPVYESYSALNDPARNALFASGLIATNAALSALAAKGNKTGTAPFWKDLDASGEPDYTNDDPADKSTPAGVTAGEMVYRKAFVHKSFASMDLVAELLAENPLQHIRNRFGFYWTRQLQKRLIAMTNGILASNVANNAGDMVIDISGAAGAAAQFTTAAMLDAEYTLGDAVGGLTGMAVHSAVARKMAGLDLLDTEHDSDGKVVIVRYQGKIVVIDDTLPVSGVGVDRVFTSVLFGPGAFGFGGAEGTAVGIGEGTPEHGSYVTRTEDAGNGGGMETIGERKTWLLHPFGFSWNEAGGGALAEFSPTLADLAVAAKWSRVVDRKQVPLAFLKSKV